MARERYLVGAGEDTIHSGVIELKTAKDRRSNWWYYHKKYLLIGLVLAAVAVSVVYSVVSKVKPDYSIGLITSFNLPGEILEQMEDYVAGYAQDRNGDGQVVVAINSYVFPETKSGDDVQMTQANFTRMTGDAITNTCMIYLAEPEAFLRVAGDFRGFFQYNDGSPMPEEQVDYENAMRPYEDFKTLADFHPDLTKLPNWTPEVVDQLLSRLKVMVRTSQDAAFAEDEKDMAYYQDSLELLARLEGN